VFAATGLKEKSLSTTDLKGRFDLKGRESKWKIREINGWI